MSTNILIVTCLCTRMSYLPYRLGMMGLVSHRVFCYKLFAWRSATLDASSSPYLDRIDYVGCIAAGPPHYHVFLHLDVASSNSHDPCSGYYTEQGRWSRPKACVSSCPLKAPTTSFGEDLGFAFPTPPSGSRTVLASVPSPGAGPHNLCAQRDGIG